MIKPRLYIMARAPEFARTKTRLAADIGKVHALRHYRSMLSRVLRNVQDSRWQTIISMTPVRDLGQVPEFHGYEQMAQVSGSLSLKLTQVFQHKGPTIVIGTDCPQVRARDIADGFQALHKFDTVFGPASDGGFWLMGMCGPISVSSRHQAAIFDNVRWSHAQTLSDLEANIDGEMTYLRTLTDIDDLKALQMSRAGLL